MKTALCTITARVCLLCVLCDFANFPLMFCYWWFIIGKVWKTPLTKIFIVPGHSHSESD